LRFVGLFAKIIMIVKQDSRMIMNYRMDMRIEG